MVETEVVENLEFKWGKKRGVGGRSKNVQFYESFVYDGVEYNLFDSVYVYGDDQPEPYIGKLIKIWEIPDKAKKVKILWYFRPCEISNFLGGEMVDEKELFLACGEGLGVANVNPLEAIAGKCNVICTSSDSRNLQPSDEDLQSADYYFYRFFDVVRSEILIKIDGQIAGHDVKFLFNKVGSQKPSILKLDPREKEGGKESGKSKGLLAKEKPSIGEKLPLFPEKNHTIEALPNKKESNSKDNAISVERMDAKTSGDEEKLEALTDNKERISNCGTISNSHVKAETSGDEEKPKALIDNKESNSNCNAISDLRIEAKTSDVEEKLKGVVRSDIVSFERFDKMKRDESSLRTNDDPLKKSKIDKLTLKPSTQGTNDDSFKKRKHDESVMRLGDKDLSKIDIDSFKKLKSSKNDPHGIENSHSNKLKPNGKNIELDNAKISKASPRQASQKDEKIDEQGVAQTQVDKSKWFKDLPWRERLESAYEHGRLVLLQNIDPLYTSADVEELVKQAFDESCTAKMIHQISFSSPHSGQAFVILRSKQAAESVVRKLDEGCLWLPNAMPLVARFATPLLDRQSAFVGHLNLDKFKYHFQREMREAVSTSHCAQPNTLEYEMAIEWFHLQECFDKEWKMMHEKQGEELTRCRKMMKSKGR